LPDNSGQDDIPALAEFLIYLAVKVIHRDKKKRGQFLIGF